MFFNRFPQSNKKSYCRRHRKAADGEHDLCWRLGDFVVEGQDVILSHIVQLEVVDPYPHVGLVHKSLRHGSNEDLHAPTSTSLRK